MSPTNAVRQRLFNLRSYLDEISRFKSNGELDEKFKEALCLSMTTII